MQVLRILKDWIIDTSVTNYMVFDIRMLNKASLLDGTNSKNMQLLNGHVAQITQIGSSITSDNSTLTNVFLLPLQV